MNQPDANRSPQECIEGILRFSDDPKLRAVLRSMLMEVQSTNSASDRWLESLVRLVESSSDPNRLLVGWIEDFGFLHGQAATDPTAQAHEELDRQLLGAQEDAAALEVLRRYYHRERLRQALAYHRQELAGPAYRASLSDTAKTVLKSVCNRVLASPTRQDVWVGVIALREFANGQLFPDGQWPVLAIYQQSHEFNISERLDSERSVTRWALQGPLDQAVERQIDRICEWIESITDGSVTLSWPLQIPSIEAFSRRVSHHRSLLDALPSQATALHAPMLLDAIPAGGDAGLCEGFLKESKSILFPSFRTQADMEYLAGYFGEGLSKLQRAEAAPWGALDGLISIDSIVRLANRSRLALSQDTAIAGPLQEAFFSELQEAVEKATRREPQVWLDPDLASQWFEHAFGTRPIESRLAQSILVPCPFPTAANGLAEDSAWSKDSLPLIAQQMLQECAQEQIAALSSRNCRYHFSRIVDSLVERVGRTPSPELTLRNIVATGKSLGGKGVLWELFSSHGLLMDLYIRLCGTSPYLVQILLSNPGMIDDLLDSLMLERIPDYRGFESALGALCKGTQSIESVVLSFRNAMHLAIGVRDILGRENITEIHRALADVHEVCLRSLVSQAYRTVAEHHPPPRNPDGTPVDYAVMLIGKLASREPNYHSDVSMLVLYDSTVASHGVFFQQVAHKLISMANRVTRYGRLFELKAWQPMGPQGSPMAWNPGLLIQAIERSELPIEQRMNLYTARLIGESAYAEQTELIFERFLQSQEWNKHHTFALIEYRRGLEVSASPENIKRGWGGTLDVEVLVHSFYAKHLHKPKYPWLRGTVERLEALRKSGVISPRVALELRDAYHFLRSVESGLRLMNTKLRHDLLKDPLELSKLAYVLQLPDREQLIESCEHYRQTVQDVAQRQFARWRSEVIASE